MKKFIVIAVDDNIQALDMNGDDVDNAHVVAFVEDACCKESAMAKARKVMAGVYEDLIAYEITGD